jgi:hypothetical protein
MVVGLNGGNGGVAGDARCQSDIVQRVTSNTLEFAESFSFFMPTV